MKLHFTRPALSAREQQLVLAVAAVVAAWAGLSMIVQPLWGRWQQLGHEAEAAEAKLERLRRLAARKPAIEQRHQQYAGLVSSEAPELVQRSLLDELEQLAQETAVQINLKPRPLAPSQAGVAGERLADRVGVEVDIDATQESLLAFLDRLLAQPSLIDLERLRISATPSAALPLRATLLVNKLMLRPQGRRS